MKKFSAREAFSYSWETFKKNWKYFLGLEIVFLLVSFVPSAVLQKVFANNVALNIPIQILLYLYSLVLAAGLTKILLSVIDGKFLPTREIFTHYRLVWPLFITSIVVGFLILLLMLPAVIIFFGVSTILSQNAFGPFLTVILGVAFAVWVIYVSLRLFFWQYVVIDKNPGVQAAIRTAWNMTKGAVWPLFLFGLLAILVTLLGALLLGVGLLVTIPVVQVATVYLYKKLSQ